MPPESARASEQKEQWNIVILGDWTVDEQWPLVRHQSGLSSHVGAHHYRVSSEVAPIRSLSGAGHVARFLHRRREAGRDAYRIFGFGDWRETDTPLLEALFDRDSAVRQPGFELRLEPEASRKPPAVALRSLRPQSGTTRIIRLYHETREGRRQWGRIDWQEPESAGAREVEDWCPAFDGRVAVVVYDIGKGAVSKPRIETLHRRCPNADWYVFSPKKLDLFAPEKLDWWDVIKDRVRILFLGPDVLSQASALNSWLVGRWISYECFDILDNKLFDVPTTVLLSERHEVIARIAGGERYVTAPPVARRATVGKIGWASTVFGCLVQDTYRDQGRVTGEKIRKALIAAEAAVYRNLLPSLSTETVAVEPVISGERKWSDEEKLWETALRSPDGHGIIREPGVDPRLEVWRSTTDLPGYIACVQEKREVLREIASSLRAYKRGTHQRSLGILLTADPGAGKTSLVRKLADRFDFSFIECNLTQVLNREELLDFFDKIAARQAKSDDDVLVFVDEVNAPVGSSTVYGAFLAPLEDGTYVRGLKPFKLRPCVWVFAGTGQQKNARSGGNPPATNPETKWNDLRSRISLSVHMDFEALKKEVGEGGVDKLTKELRLEQLYLGAVMIKGYQPDVTRISREVLYRFYALDPTRGPSREIAKRAALLSNVKYGRVDRSNWGESWGTKVTGELDPIESAEMVTLEFEAERS